MEWKLRINKKALELIEKLAEHQKRRVLTGISIFCWEGLNKGMIPFHSMDIK